MKKLIQVLFILVCVLSTNAQTELNDDNAESKLLVNNDRLIVLDFYATWCGPCKRMEPIIKELASKYKNVDFYKIDVDKQKVDDALGVNAMPTYLFIKNKANLEQIEGAMSKAKMIELIEKHLNSNTTTSSTDEFYDATANHGKSTEFNDTTIKEIWNFSSKLNSLAWHAYNEHNDINELLKAIDIVKRSIELEETYYNVDTHAALLFKTGNYTKALKKAKDAISVAKKNGLKYDSTTELMNKIIDKL
jgi:thioredoxin 1